MKTIAVSSLVVLLAACSPTRLEDLPAPAIAVVVTEGGGFCASVFAVDADRTAWSGRDCESSSDGLVAADARASDAERADLDAMLDDVLALPEDGDCAVPSPSGRRYRFVRTGGDPEAWPESRQCDPGVPLVALDLAARLEALSAPPGATPDAG